MKYHSTLALALLGFTALAQPAMAQSNSVDPACIMKNADGAETVDRVKCPDGMKPAASNSNTAPATGTDTTGSANTGTTTDQNTSTTNSQNNTTTTTDQNSTTSADQNNATSTDPQTTGSIDATNRGGLIVPPESFANAKVMTASDYIGKRVYTRSGEDIGEVNDLIVTDNGAVQAVILGVGGFLGIGEKDVAVSMQSIEMQQQDNTTRLVVDATKDQLNGAPVYDRSRRSYVN